ncbi:MAG: hypothetical protein HUJ90_05380 [Bacteroidales bacterium]|nr:hypothetical protein [Bacteroidales bacterium]
MKKIFLSATMAVALFGAISCSDNGPKSAEDQKAEFKDIATELKNIGKEAYNEDIFDLGVYYKNTLSSYNTSAISDKCGDIFMFVETLFNALPNEEPTLKGISSDYDFTKAFGLNIDLSNLIKKAEFYANAKTKKWEFRGEGAGDGIYFYFNDDQNRECHLKISTSADSDKLQNGNFKATVALYLQNKMIAENIITCDANSLADFTANMVTSYGDVKNSTVLSSKNGEYGVKDFLYYGDKKIASCIVAANGVEFGKISNMISLFKYVTVNVDLMDRMQVVANVSSSIPDLFLTNWNKDYITKLQEYLDENVDIKVYYTGSKAQQATITLKVQQTGAPLFGTVEVVPYISFTQDDQSYELSSLISVESMLPDILKYLESILGNIKLEI